MRIHMDMEKIESKRKLDGISKLEMSRMVGASRPAYYFDLLRHSGRTNKIDRVRNFIQWFGSTDCVRSWSLQGIKDEEFA